MEIRLRGLDAPHPLGLVLTEALRSVDGEFRVPEAGEDLVFLPVGVGEVCLVPALDLIKGRFRDIHVSFLNEPGRQPVQHGEDQRPYLEAVHVGVGAYDYLIPAEILDIEAVHVLRMFRRHLNAAAHDFQKVCYYLALEYLVIIRFEAVENLSSYRHDSLELCISGLFAGSQSRIALYDIQFPFFNVFRAAVDEFLDSVGDIQSAGQFFPYVEPCALRCLTAPLVYKYLFGDLIRFCFVLDKVYLELRPEEVGHRLLDKFVRDRLFRLVLV